MKDINFPYVKLFVWICKVSVVTVTVYLYDYYKSGGSNQSTAVLDKTLSLLNSTLNEIHLNRLVIKNLRIFDDDPRG